MWESARLYGARLAFSTSHGFLLDQQPRVLAIGWLQALDIPGIGRIGPPEAFPIMGGRTRSAQPAKAFNPSIARAPRGLCPRCTYAITLRIDTLHQCSTSSSPYTGSSEQLSASTWFQGTVVGILDEQMRLIGWTWLINSPEYQIASADYNESTARRAGCVVAGAADSFQPPWAKQIFDARLLNVHGELLVTYACSGCAFSLSPLRLTAEPTADGGLRQLRAWAPRRIPFQGSGKWLSGRNQALFMYEAEAQPAATSGAASTAGSRATAPQPLSTRASVTKVAKEDAELHHRRGASLWIQPRLGIVGLLGWPKFERPGPVNCRVGANRRRGHRPEPNHCHGDRKGIVCGTTPHDAEIEPRVLTGVRGREAKLRANGSFALRRALRVAGAFGGLSLTSNLVRIARPRVGGRGCEVYLGVGHLHRGEGSINRHLYKRRANAPPWERNTNGSNSRHTDRLRRRQPFAFGFRYTHFFYALDPHPPFATAAASGEFCIGAPQDARDCESVQFISGIALKQDTGDDASASTLLLTFGVNDCEARLGSLPISEVWKMLRPLRLPGTLTDRTQACWPEHDLWLSGVRGS